MARVGPEVSNVLEEVVPNDVNLVSEKFTNAQKLKIHTYRFVAKGVQKPTGVVCLCHGFAAHSSFDWLLPTAPGEPHSKWAGSILDSLVRSGYAVCTVDHQSHGHSEGAKGLRCYFKSFDHLPQESLDFLTQVVLEDASLKGLPVFVLGMSMGGATALRMSQLRPKLFKGMVLWSPMLSLEEVKKQRLFLCIRNAHLKPIVKLLVATIPKVPLAKKAKNPLHPLCQKECDEERLNYQGDCRVIVAGQFSDVTDKWMRGDLKNVTVPFITYHCVKDSFTDPFGSSRLLGWASAADKTYKRVGSGADIDADMFHCLSTEPGYEKVHEDTMQWLNVRC